MSWALQRVRYLSDDDLRAEKDRHCDDGTGWCAADCTAGILPHWHPCEMYEAVIAERGRRRARTSVGA